MSVDLVHRMMALRRLEMFNLMMLNYVLFYTPYSQMADAREKTGA